MNNAPTKIVARVERVLYPKDPDAIIEGSSTFYIIKCDVGTVKGKLSHYPKVDECLTLDGRWGVSSYNGQPEFSFNHATVYIPKDERALLKYACTMTKGIGPALEEKIWDACGEDWRNVCESDGIKGLSSRLICELQNTIDFIRLHGEQAKTISWLVGIGTTVKMAEYAFEKWGTKTIEKVKEDPYVLCQLPHYGFKDVDSHIRHYFGIGTNDERRINACLNYFIAQATQENTVVEWDELLANATKAIDADPSVIADCAAKMMHHGRIIGWEATMRIAPQRLFMAESIIWKAILESHELPHTKARQPRVRDFDLDETQMDAVQYALDHSFSIINGGAGCGKTTLVKAICDSLKTSVELCAFAGKAAARLKEATCHDAGTIHRMLGYMGETLGFTRKTLAGCTVILDEASMVSSDLMAEIVKRNPYRLILVGDEAQLPPVGSGQPFHDIISLKPEVVKTLKTCYRNTEAIFASAINIRHGITPPPEAKSERELWRVHNIKDLRDTHSAVLKIVKAGEVDFDCDIILCCRNGDKAEDANTACTVLGFNRDIKEIVNPNEDGSFKIAAGDRIINTKNNAELDVWNGTTGRCREFDCDNAMWVDLDFPRANGEKTVLIPKGEVKDWQLAYALTVHKSQGSQYRKVFFVSARRDILTLLSRPMIYTAVTRAKRECHILGDTFAFYKSIGTTQCKRTVIQELAGEK